MDLKKESFYLMLFCFYCLVSSIHVDIKAKTNPQEHHQHVAQDKTQNRSKNTSKQIPPTISLSTSFYFLYDHLRFLIHDHAKIYLLTPKNQDPAHYTPSEAEIQTYQNSDLIFLNGAGFESFEKKIMLPKSKITYTSQPFKKEWLKSKTQDTHQHGKQGIHQHASTDPHTWLDPVLAIQQIKSMHLKLKTLYVETPDLQKTLDQRFETLKVQFEAIDQQWQSLDLKNVLIFTGHPAYGYLAKRYQLNLQDFDFDIDLPIDDAKQAKQFELLLAQKKKALMANPNQKIICFWEASPHPSLLKALADQRIPSFLMRTLESEPLEGSYLKAVFADIQALSSALKTIDDQNNNQNRP
jgi:ABC-type Zn uptake system ZnuABC Zn-binding protein ZnuA